MPARLGAGTAPEGRPDQTPPQHRGRRRLAVRRTAYGVLFVTLAVGLFGLLPRLGGLTRDAEGLRHARPAFLAAAIVAQAASLGSYAQLYRRILAALRARVRYRLAADVILATFFVSHLTPFGSATGTLVNASTLESEGIAAATTGEGIALTSLTSTMVLLVLFGAGFAATAGRHVSWPYLVVAGIALFRCRSGADRGARRGRPSRRRRAGRTLGRRRGPALPARYRSGQGRSDRQPPRVTGPVRADRTAFLASFGFASADLLLDLLSLDLVFVALRYQPGFGPLAVAYGAANIASAIPLTPGGMGVIEVTLVAITVGFGAPRPTAVLAVLGYRIVNYWLPLIPGAIAYLRLRLVNQHPSHSG